MWNIQAGDTEVVIEVDLPPDDESEPPGDDKPQPLIISGQLKRPDGRPINDTLVRVFERNLRTERYWGEAFSKQGCFTVKSTPENLIEETGADLIVRAYSETGEAIAESEIQFNIKKFPQKIDLTVPYPEPEAEKSEIELLIELLGDYLAREGVTFSELTDNDIDFIVKDLNKDKPLITERRVRLLAQSARLAEETNLSIEAFYGWLDRDLPMMLLELLALPDDTLRDALQNSIENKIIPESINEEIEQIIERINQLRFERGLLVSRQLAVRLASEEDNFSLQGFTVQVIDLDAGPTLDLGSFETDNRGEFLASYITSGDIEGERQFRISVLDGQGELFFETEIQVPLEQDTAFIIEVPAAVIPEPPSPTLNELTQVLNLELPQGLGEFLAEANIQSLADIRKAGGISQLENLPVATDNETVRLLDAHANLSLLSSNLEINTKLIAKGYPNIQAIAATPRTNFVANLYEDIGDAEATSLSISARAQTAIAGNLIAGAQIAAANGFDFNLGLLDFPSKCSCEDCEAAVSPGAYLVDLLDYTLKHVTRSGANIDFAYLYEKFHQPFSDLALSCESVEEQIRQIRICVEVLRSALDSSSSDPTDSELLVAEKNYRLATYSGILTKIGTSLQEIRAARRQDDEERKKIGDRLAIPVIENRAALPQGDPLDRLFLNPGVGIPGDLSAIPEQELEILFGLVDTNRDILSTGAKVNDSNNQILRWQLEGVQWNQNTNSEGKIYLILNRVDDQTQIFLFTRRNTTRLLAEGRISTTEGEIVVQPRNGSELSGRFQVAYTADTPIGSPIELSVVPLYLSWRLQYLRTLWEEQDWIQDDYSQGLLPIMDPDIIGPDDFRHPYEDNEDGTFQIWVNRREWVDERLQELESDRFLEGDPPSPNLIAIFNHMYNEEISYGGSSFPAAWQNSTPVSDPVSEFSALLQTLTTGKKEEIDEVRDRLKSDLNLTVESFTHLMEIYETDQQAKRDYRAESVTEEAWHELYSILVQAKKESLYPNWIEEEASIVEDLQLFSPRSFWISLREPVEGDWSSKLGEVENRPSIDPEKLSLKDLPEFTAGIRARGLWKSRTEELKNDLQALKNVRESADSTQEGFNETLLWAFGSDYDLDNLDRLLEQIDGDDETIAETAETSISNELRLTIENFRRLMTLKQKNDSGTEPLTPTELNEFYNILNTANKGFNNALLWTFGRDNNINELLDNLDNLLTQLASNIDSAVEEAESRIQEELRFSIENFRRLMTLKQKNGSGNKPLTTPEWNEVYTILNMAHKQLIHYERWIETENTLPYWRLLKAKLPKWRSSSESRQAWKIALKQRSQPPLIDPDLIDTGHLDTPLSNNPAYDIWNRRHQELTEQFADLQDKPEDSSENLSWLGQALTTILDLDEIAASELFTELRDAQAEGNSITPRLAQYGLTNASFAYLNRIVELLENDPTAPILDSEWESVDNILVQLWKQRQFAEWLAEEKESSIILSPDYFVIPEPEPFTFPLPEPTPLKEWRASRQALNQWEDDLQARIDQQENAENALSEAISAIEEETLPMLRDALIREVDTEEGDLKQKAERLADRFQIDTQDSGCRVTTRIGQAIETLQTFLWSHRTGQLGAEFTDLDELNHAEFDEEWKWLGSYANWRAAIFVYIYPENILIPSLKRWQTPAFRNLLRELRTNRRLTPEQACAAANRYSDYLRDIANLRVAASCTAQTFIANDLCTGTEERFAQNRKRSIVHKFAISTLSSRVFWSTFDRSQESDFAHSFWQPLSAFDNEQVINIVGAVPYVLSDRQSYLYLFVKIQVNKEDKLVYLRFNLETGKWDGEQFNELDPPDDATKFTVIVKQTADIFNSSKDTNNPPQLAFRLKNRKIYIRSLREDGTDWEDSDPQEITKLSGLVLVLLDWVEVDPETSFLITSDNRLKIRYYRITQRINEIITSSTQIDPRFNLFDYQGVVYYPGQRGIYLFIWDRNVSKYYFIKPAGEVTRIEISQNSLAEWLTKNTNVSLAEIRFNVQDTELSLPAAFNTVLGVLEEGSSDNSLARRRVPQIDAGIRGFFERISREDTPLSRKWKNAAQLLVENSDLEGIFEDPDALEVLKKILIELLKLISGGQREIKSSFLYFEDNISPELKPSSFNIGRIPPHSGIYLSEDISNDSWRFILTYQIVAYQTDNTRNRGPWCVSLQLTERSVSEPDLIKGEDWRLTPILVDAPFDISEQLSTFQLKQRKSQLRSVFLNNQEETRSNKTYLNEAYYFVPIQVALYLQKRGHYVNALDWFRSVYNYSTIPEERKISPFLRTGSFFRGSRPEDWLLDPLNMHEIARNRPGAYTRFTLISIIRCLFDYADSEFTLDTNESVAKARELYTTALELLKLPDLDQSVGQCSDVIAELETEVGSRIADEALERLSEWRKIVQLLQKISNPEQLNEVRQQILVNTSSQIPWSEKLNSIRKVIAAATPPANAPQQIGVVLREQERSLAKAQTALLVDTNTAMTIMEASSRVKDRVSSAIANAINGNSNNLPWLRNNELANRLAEESSTENEIFNKIAETLIRPYTPILKFSFCIPPNPVLNSLKLYGELNLYKIRTCRNFAGMERQLEPYSAATDTVSGLPQIGAGGQLVLPGANRLMPTIYRFETLIERAKQLVQYANQVEASLLSAIEKRDAESYNQLTARQQIKLSREGIRLQTLRVRAAESEVDLAELQQERAQIQVDYYQGLLEQGLLDFEKFYKGAMIIAAILQGASAASSMNIAGRLSSLAAAASTTASLFQTLASFERREQEWEFQSKLAQQDVRIGAQNIKLAEDRVRIVGQERRIAEIQTDHAKETLDFLINKFTNVELYDWMSDVLEGVYSLILQQGTATSKLAEIQLAFERQEVPPAFIQTDYWNAATDEAVLGTLEGNAPDRRGLTGSARLLQDIIQLDQYAFENNKRKLQLTKTISLAQLSPAEFQRFRETGVLLFSTPMELFDRDFPGHYLRLIKRVRTSVIALIPPNQGIKATLISTGASRVTIGGIIFQTVNRNIGPQVVALSSPQEATGLFELQQQSELLLPFEGLGVDTSWEFRMPKASNQFDFNTIADILITLDYTALDNSFYRQQVLQELDNSFSASRPFSFRNEFADQWYDLNNPEQTTTPMVVRFQTRREDFPPNLDNLRIQHITLYFARANGITLEIPVTRLLFTEQNSVGTVGGGANSIDGIIATRIGNAPSWTAITDKPSPFGEWELALLENLTDGRTTKDLFQNEEIEDILFVITYSGRTPEWPE
ncbi:MAG: hypothetical protein QNJ53_14910 [Pleurocapsa sp. MO_192.B19]|nr:hypothetical protein [Pleurocapsa sp. MO_192.B19]